MRRAHARAWIAAGTSHAHTTTLEDCLHAYETHESPDDMLRAAPLDAAKRTRAEEIVVRLAQLSRAFVENLAAATAGWTKHVPDEAALEGMPGRARRRARLHAQAQQQDGFLLTLDAPSYADAVQHLADRKLRHDVYEAYVTRASDHGPRKRLTDALGQAPKLLP